MTTTAGAPGGDLGSGESTPWVRVDLDRLDANITRAAEWAAARGVRLRPHAKTHKSLRSPGASSTRAPTA